MSEKNIKLNLKEAHPDLCEEWLYEKNAKRPEEFTPGSSEIVWWKCRKCGGEWKASILNRSHGRGCPFCAGQKVLKGFNDFETKRPDLLKTWDYEKNGKLGIQPDMVTSGSNKKVWWRCDKGHSYECTIKNRVHGQGCPYCSGRRVLKGYNDLCTTNPELVHEWDYEKNEDLKPNQVTPFSHKDVWWKCAEGHSWKSKISNRSNGLGCPYCNGTRAIVGVNDLMTVHPELAEEWDYEKNDANPLELKSGSNIKVWWKCKRCGHIWQTSPNKRTYEKTGCPRCGNKGTSFSEIAVYYYLKKLFPRTINRYKVQNNEIDIYVPEVEVGIEYDGFWYHKDKKENDINKAQTLNSLGVRLINIRENGLDPVPQSTNIVREKQSIESLEKCIREALSILGCEEISDDYVDIKRDFSKIQEEIFLIDIENNIQSLAPHFVEEWNYEKNGNLKPSQVSCFSNQKVWWKCEKGHEWTATPAHRMEGKGCPYCAGRKVLKGYNDLVTVDPSLASQWDYEKNINISPDEITASSHKKVWWRCEKGHSWQATVKSRHEGNSCPYCSGLYVVSGYNDLETTHPDIAKYWDYDKNNGLRPSEILPGTRKKVWWRCPLCGESYLQAVVKRVSKECCPNCSKKRTSEKNSKKVKCMETGTVFNSLSDASKWASVSKSLIGQCARGEVKTAGGYRWTYID